MRHADFRVRKDARDGTPLFDQDATFCAQPGRAGGGGVTLASYNIAGHHVRHFAEAVHIAVPGGSHAFDAAASYDQDVTWAVASPWAP
ncbi:AbfB domain-containing protein [Nonomuraea rubra]|uniref:AbfB domain-containing protein n=1 Tax=Nonomuraea rubra TaxID=46180 RepID=UPI00361BC08B